MSRPCTDPHHVHRLIQPTLTDLTDRLRAGDRRITAPREAILNVLRQHALPLTNREIHRLLNDDCDLATVYRNLHTLAGMSLVKRVDFGDGVARWELVGDAQTAHHHHLICTGCSTVIEIDDCFPRSFEKALANRHHFAEITHRLEFFGICPNCQTTPKKRRAPSAGAGSKTSKT
jgi:Fur family ferric uptake transcriptional regulator